MDYIDRLIQRALAQPRGAEPALFDPFERVAGWPLETRPGVAPKPTAPTEAARETPTTEPTQPVLPPAPAAVEAQLRTAVAPAPAPLPQQPAPATPRNDDTAALRPTPPAPAQDAPTRAPERSAEVLARADAFMRTLGVPGVPAHPAVRAGNPASTAPLPAVGPAPRPAALHTPASASPPTPARLQPPAPSPVRAAPVTARATRPAPASQAPTAALPRTPRRDTPAPVVQTTVVVAPPARTLDDLAQSAGIVRFGLGQL